jgi:hypothetical protein
MLPSHGRISCNACFEGASSTSQPHAKWRMTNDPGGWGSSTPTYLVLGFSKGSTQANAYANGRFEDVAFAGMRSRMTRSLRHFEWLKTSETADQMIADPNGRFAFGSLIRCSVARLDAVAAKKGDVRYSCTGPLINKSFEEIPTIISTCSRRFLVDLPPTLKIVIFLGNGDKYVDGCQEVVRTLYPQSFRRINPMAVSADNRLWLHLSHPSGLNGHFETWLSGDIESGGRKRLWVEEAVRTTRHS